MGAPSSRLDLLFEFSNLSHRSSTKVAELVAHLCEGLGQRAAQRGSRGDYGRFDSVNSKKITVVVNSAKFTPPRVFPNNPPTVIPQQATAAERHDATKISSRRSDSQVIAVIRVNPVAND